MVREQGPAFQGRRRTVPGWTRTVRWWREASLERKRWKGEVKGLLSTVESEPGQQVERKGIYLEGEGGRFRGNSIGEKESIEWGYQVYMNSM